jgi:primosomal protein N' (replication factor Y)
MEIVQVIIGISTKALDRPFTYIIPKTLIDLVEVGSVVLVPFGKGNTLKEAYVIDRGILTKEPDYQLKKIHEVIYDVKVEKELIKLAYWIHKRYECNITSALKLMVPTDVHSKVKTHKVVTLDLEQIRKVQEAFQNLEVSKLTTKRQAVLRSLLATLHEDSKKPIKIPLKEALQIGQTTHGLLKTLQELGYLTIIDDEIGRDIHVLRKGMTSQEFCLNNEQKMCVDKVTRSLNEQETFLLYGITGSGKTEVYMQLIQKVLNRGESVIVLIPEIGLTPLTTRRFVERFGPVVGVQHSKLNAGERYEQWLKAKRGEIQIMVGARSAIFTPFNKIGLIIIDEEHEHTYKSEQNPRYHAREVAIKRSIDHQCPVVLGSATPLIESYHKAMTNNYTLLNLTARAVEGSKRQVTMIDMRHELENGNMSILSYELEQGIMDALKNQEQIILFINRRGFANFVSCRKCGFVYTCKHCDVSMTYHANNKRMICHYCGYSLPVDKTCPECGSSYLKAFGAGTQKIQSYIKKNFPNAKIARMDQDTTQKKHGHELILKAFEDKEIDILIGTQMIAKGHDFHNVSVVGVLAADLSLHIDDFRAAERTFQLVTQVIGRTGRGDVNGHAFIQTYSPDHFALKYALEENYIGFYNEEVLFRRAMIYPPFCHILQVITLTENEELGMRFLNERVEKIENFVDKEKQFGDIIVLGPAKAGIGRVKGKYRHRLLVKGSSYKQLTNIRKELYNSIDNKLSQVLQIHVDINPLIMY